MGTASSSYLPDSYLNFLYLYFWFCWVETAAVSWAAWCLRCKKCTSSSKCSALIASKSDNSFRRVFLSWVFALFDSSPVAMLLSAFDDSVYHLRSLTLQAKACVIDKSASKGYPSVSNYARWSSLVTTSSSDGKTPWSWLVLVLIIWSEEESLIPESESSSSASW